MFDHQVFTIGYQPWFVILKTSLLPQKRKDDFALTIKHHKLWQASIIKHHSQEPTLLTIISLIVFHNGSQWSIPGKGMVWTSMSQNGLGGLSFIIISWFIIEIPHILSPLVFSDIIINHLGSSSMKLAYHSWFLGFIKVAGSVELYHQSILRVFQPLIRHQHGRSMKH